MPPPKPTKAAGIFTQILKSCTAFAPCLCRVWPEEDADDVTSLLSLVYHVTGGMAALPRLASLFGGDQQSCTPHGCLGPWHMQYIQSAAGTCRRNLCR